MGGNGWNWPTVRSRQLHIERFTFMRPIPYEMTIQIDPESVRQEFSMARQGKALSINISSGGMLLLMDQDLEVGQVMKVNVPTPISQARTPTLAEVRWTLGFPMTLSNWINFVGLKFMI